MKSKCDEKFFQKKNFDKIFNKIGILFLNNPFLSF
jgi:hypothetical protein